MANSDEIEFRDLLILIFKRSWIVAIFALASGLIGYHKASKLPDLFRSTTLLVPSSATSGGRSALPEGSVGQSGRSSELSLYQALMTSRTVMMEVLRNRVSRSSRDMAVVDVATFLGVDTADPIAMQVAAAQLANSVRLDDGGEGILNLSFTSTDPMVAPQLADLVVEVTQRELNRIRSDKLRTILEQEQKSVDDLHNQYTHAALHLAGYSDSNIDMQSARLLMHKDELSSELKVREETYLLARQRADQTRMELDQIYPPAVVFDPASRPAIRVGPDRYGQTLLWVFAGAVVGLALVLVWEFLLKKKAE